MLDLADVDQVERLLRDLEPATVVQLTGGIASDAVRLVEINLVPTVNLLRAAARLDPSPVIFVTGSAAEYGDPGSSPASEDISLHPVSPYGWIKLAETAIALEMGRRHDLDVTVTRPFNPIMPDLPVTTALGNFRDQILAGEGSSRSVICGNVEVIRDFVSGAFIGEAIAKLIESPPGGVVNICSGVGLRLAEVMDAAAELLGVAVEFEQDSELMELPAPAVVIGDPSRLNTLTKARALSTPEYLAAELMGRPQELR